MKSRIEIVEVWGIPIRIHLSWLLVFGLVSWSLAAGYFPAEYPGWTAGAYWAIGAVTALAFFASILIHELGHSWVARRNGIPIESITLFVFGGVARISREPETPGVEFRMAIAGPVTSVVLAGIMVKQGKLEKAIDIYHKLIWKFPQKKSYFAAQIEILKEKISKQ